MNYFVCILNAKIIIYWEKDFGCKKTLEDYGKTLERCVSCALLRNWSYLIMSSSSSALLLDILIFHSDVPQCLFCLLIGCIQQFHWLIFPADTDVFKTSSGRFKKVTTSYDQTRHRHDVWKMTSDLRRLEDVWFTSSWRRPIYDVLKTSNLRRLEDVCKITFV